MSAIAIGLITFVCVFGGSLLGLYLRKVLPGHHLRDDSKDAVRTGVAMIATLAALVLGLLISSGKDSLDSINAAFTQNGARIIMLDRVLKSYGPETKEIREQLRDTVQSLVERIWSKDRTRKTKSPSPDKTRGMELVVDNIRSLVPQNEPQRLLQLQALQIGNDLLQSRWLIIEQAHLALPAAFLVILIFWVTIIFISIGLFSPYNSTVIVVLLVCAMSVSCAVFLIQDMSHPFGGVFKISSAPFVNALEHLGR
jgi:hypothetical protein